MLPGARLAAVIEILDQIEASDTAAESILRSYFRSRRYAGSKDRRSVGEHVYDIFRHRARLDWWIAGASGDMQPDSRKRVMAFLHVLQGMTAEDVSAVFDGSGHNPPPLSETEGDLSRNLDGKPLLHDAMPAGVLMEVPEWLTQPLQDLWGDRFDAEMSALNAQAPVDLRVNLSRVTLQQARKALARDGIKTEPCPISPSGLRLVERARLEDTKPFKQGLVEIQDEGSQLIALLTDAKPGMTVIDYCAGGGGKTLALADRMGLQGNAKGRLVACDVSPKRLSGLDPRVTRAGVKSVETFILDGKNRLKVSADRVLVDAPCSGLGAWRRHPEARWRLTQEKLTNYLETQTSILRNAAEYVKPGGRLIYATCSLLPWENESQIDRFLKSHKDFKTLPIADVWETTIGEGCPVACPSLTISPATTGTDGFFCQVMERKD